MAMCPAVSVCVPAPASTMSVCLSLCASMSVCLCASVCVSVSVSRSMSVCPCVSAPLCLSVCVPVDLPMCLWPSVCESVFVHVGVSVSPYVPV